MSLNRQFRLLLNAIATQMLVLFNNGGFSQVYLCLTYVLATCSMLMPSHLVHWISRHLTTVNWLQFEWILWWFAASMGIQMQNRVGWKHLIRASETREAEASFCVLGGKIWIVCVRLALCRCDSHGNNKKQQGECKSQVM